MSTVAGKPERRHTYSSIEGKSACDILPISEQDMGLSTSLSLFQDTD